METNPRAKEAFYRPFQLRSRRDAYLIGELDDGFIAGGLQQVEINGRPPGKIEQCVS